MSAYTEAETITMNHPMKCKHDIPLNLGCDHCGRTDQEPERASAAQGADWSETAMAEVKDYLHLRGYYLQELEKIEIRAIIAKHCQHAPAQPAAQAGAVKILTDALEAIAINEDRSNLDGDSVEETLEQCNKIAEEALEDYAKQPPADAREREISEVGFEAAKKRKEIIERELFKGQELEWQKQPDRDGWWIWRECRHKCKTELLLLVAGGAEVADDSVYEAETGLRDNDDAFDYNYWEGTATTEIEMPGNWIFVSRAARSAEGGEA